MWLTWNGLHEASHKKRLSHEMAACSDKCARYIGKLHASFAEIEGPLSPVHNSSLSSIYLCCAAGRFIHTRAIKTKYPASAVFAVQSSHSHLVVWCCASSPYLHDITMRTIYCILIYGFHWLSPVLVAQFSTLNKPILAILHSTPLARTRLSTLSYGTNYPALPRLSAAPTVAHTCYVRGTLRRNQFVHSFTLQFIGNLNIITVPTTNLQTNQRLCDALVIVTNQLQPVLLGWIWSQQCARARARVCVKSIPDQSIRVQCIQDEWREKRKKIDNVWQCRLTQAKDARQFFKHRTHQSFESIDRPKYCTNNQLTWVHVAIE